MNINKITISLGLGVLGCLISLSAMGKNTCYATPSNAAACGGKQISGLSAPTCSACYHNSARIQCGCCWNNGPSQCSIQNCPALRTYVPGPVPNPQTGWSCSHQAYNIINGPQEAGNPNYYSCIYGDPVCLGWSPPPGAVKDTDPLCGNQCDPGSTPPKGQCPHITVKSCTPVVETSSTYNGVTYYLCTPGSPVYYYSCPSSATTPLNTVTPSASEGTMSRTAPGFRKGTVTPLQNHPGAFDARQR